MKKLLCALLALFILSFCGCALHPGAPDGESEDEYANAAVTVADRDGKPLGVIERYGLCTVTDSGIFYPANVPGSRGVTKEFRLFDPVSGEDRLLGTVENVYYEAAYARVEFDGTLYTLVVSGDPMDGEPDPLLLLAFDLEKGGVSGHTVSENGFPYVSMTENSGRLLIMNHDQTDILTDRLIEFDPVASAFTERLAFTLDKELHGESVRGVYAEDGRIYLLRLRFEGEGSVRALLDTYDGAYQKLSELDITDLLVQNADDPSNELMQAVDRFTVTWGRILYYENFSVTRCLADIVTGERLPGVVTDGLFAGSQGSGRQIWFDTFATLEKEGKNSIYSLMVNGTLFTENFTGSDPRYYITSGSVSPNGSLILEACYVNPDDNADALPVMIYFVPA